MSFIIIIITFLEQNIFRKQSLECKKKTNTTSDNFMLLDE